MMSRGLGVSRRLRGFAGRLTSNEITFDIAPDRRRRYPYWNNAVCSGKGLVLCNTWLGQHNGQQQPWLRLDRDATSLTGQDCVAPVLTLPPTALVPVRHTA